MIAVGLVQLNWDLNWNLAESLVGEEAEITYALLPYSVGLLRSYADANSRHRGAIDWKLPVYSRSSIATAADTLDGADIVGFSTYVWNVEGSLAIAAELKRRNPDIIIMFGGPQVPDRCEDFLRANPCIDLASHGEGEVTFTEVLDRIDSRAWSEVAGVSWIDRSNQFQSTPIRSRTTDLSEYPSPYLSGAFDDLMRSEPDRRWVALWETNRGCPFACTFCDWGSATATRVYTFGLDRIHEEVNWFSKNQIGHLICCDANFGMLPRDLEIAQSVVNAHAETGFPFSFSIQNAKNATERTYEIQSLINRSLQTIGVTLAIQSADEGTLVNIKRSNIRSESFRELQRRFALDGVDTYTDIIVGLPGESFDAFADSISKTIDFGQHNQIQFHNCSVLPNAEMANPEYIKAFGIVTVPQPLRSLYDRVDGQPEIEERLETVISTDAMPTADWIRAKTYAAFVELVYFNRLLQIPMLLLQTRNGLSFRQLMDAVIKVRPKAPITSSLIEKLQAHLETVVTGGVEYLSHPAGGDLLWPPDQFMLIDLVAGSSLDGFIDEAHTAIAETLTHSLADRDEVDLKEELLILDEAFLLNREMFRLPFRPKDKRIVISHSILKYWQQASTSEPEPLKTELSMLRIKRSDRNWDTLDSWINSLTWNQGPNRRKYLSSVETF